MAKETQFTLRISADLKEQAAAYAATQGRTLTNLIEWLLRQELKKDADNRQEGVKKMNINKVENISGTLIDFDAAVNLMDDSIREKLHNRLAPCSNQRFMTEYEKEHVKVYGEPWELSKENPTY